jgi:hypothetical protein
MFRSKLFFVLTLVVFLIAGAVAKITNPFQASPEIFKNSVGIPFFIINKNNKELHKLYKSSSNKFSKRENVAADFSVLSVSGPEEFYIEKSDLTINDFSEFISATNYTPDYFFSTSNPSETKANTPIISHQDAQVLANWLMNKERVNYQIIASDELERACRDSVDKTYLPFTLLGGGDSFDILCNTSRTVYNDVDGLINGFRLIRAVN